MIQFVGNDAFNNVCLLAMSIVVYFVNWTDSNVSEKPKTMIRYVENDVI